MGKDINGIIENMDEMFENLGKEGLIDEIVIDDHSEDIEVEPNQVEFVKCGSETDPESLAFYIATQLEDPNKPEYVIIQTIGPKALSRAVLSIISLKSKVAPYFDGQTLVTRFSIRKLQMPENQERTAIRIRLFAVPDRYIQ